MLPATLLLVAHAVAFSGMYDGNLDVLTVPAGGVPKALPFPAGTQDAFSTDGSRLAYVPNPKWQEAWKRYRGGRATPIWKGHGVDPDIEIALDPYLWRKGQDSQLMRAIEELNKRLASYTPPKLVPPPYPNKSVAGHNRG